MESVSCAMGVPHNLKVTDKKHFIQIGVWERSCCADGIYCAERKNCCADKMTKVDAFEKRLSQLIEMEEERFVAGFHQNIEKQRQKTWHDRHIKTKHFEVGGIVLMYGNKF